MILMASENIDIQPRKLYLEFALVNLDSDETSRDIRTAVLHRISIPFIICLYGQSGLAWGAIFENHTTLCRI